MEDPVRAALARIPGFDTGADITARRLGGLTNANWLVTRGDERFVLRLPGEGTGDYIDRRAEERAARATAAVGVNAEVLFFDAADGVQLCRHLDGAETMSVAGFKDPARIARAAVALRTVHREAERFATDFDLFRMIDDYLALVAKRGAELPAGYAEVQATAEACRVALALHPAETRPCHCDPLAENFLDDGIRCHVVDWEYAGNNDPMWDLGDLAVEAAFDEDQIDALVRAYFDGDMPAAARGRVVVYMAMADLLWTLWGVIQHADGNPAEDFRAYAERRLARSAARMARPDFAIHLAAVRAG